MVGAKALRKGMFVEVASGPYKGLIAEVISPTVMPDGHSEQRKMLVNIENVGNTFIIPKQLRLVGSIEPKVITGPQPNQVVVVVLGPECSLEKLLQLAREGKLSS